MKIVYWLKGDEKPYLYKGSLKKWKEKVNKYWAELLPVERWKREENGN